MSDHSLTRVAILGAGPVGLEAAHALRQEGFDVHVYEQGQVGESVRRWSHVRLFSPWRLNVSALGLSCLRDQMLEAPLEEAFPTGQEFLGRYLLPLATHERLDGRLHTGTRVIQVGREGVLKGELIGSPARREHSFRLLLEDQQGHERIEHAHVVIDTTGTYDHPNALGDSGIFAPGERKARKLGQISPTIPRLEGAEAARLEGKHVMVVGAGYSAITSLYQLQAFAGSHPGTRVTWVTRAQEAPYEVIEDDPLPARAQLANLGNAIAGGSHSSWVTHRGGASVEAIEQVEGGLVDVSLRQLDGSVVKIKGVAQIFANVGYRPDNGLYRELQVHQCYASEGPMKLAAALLSASGGGGDCLAQTSMGAETLKSPEPDFYILGSKSYGRGSSFLLKLGLEQIEDLKGLLG